jgi:hypothetical protein
MGEGVAHVRLEGRVLEERRKQPLPGLELVQDSTLVVIPLPSAFGTKRS